MTMFSKNLAGCRGPSGPPDYAYVWAVVLLRHHAQSTVLSLFWWSF